MSTSRSSCFFCDKAPIARCKSCGKPLCIDHDIYDDPFRSSGLFYRPGHWCKTCIGKRQGKVASALVVLAIVILGVLVAIAILS
nr:hypothetical protein [Candidatus Sigynarchaeum springense]